MTVDIEHSGDAIPASETFGISLRPVRRSRFDDWILSPTENESIANPVAGIDEFVGDHPNRWLRCLQNFESLKFTGTSEGIDRSVEPSHVSLSPIVFHGETGTGKTSLAISLLDCLLSDSDTDSQNDRAVRVSGSEFYRRYIAALDCQNIGDFRNRILNCSGLLIDNLDQLEGKFGAQHEFVFLVDQLIRQRVPVFVTMRHSPLQTNDQLSPPLLSRLLGGTLFPVLPPGLLARRSIIGKLSTLHRTPLTEEAAAWIAEKMTVSVPKLNHFFIQLKTQLRSLEDTYDLTQPVDMAMLGILFKQDPESLATMAAQIIETVANDFEISTSMLCGDSRKQTVVMARGIAIWFLRTMLGYSYHKIGKLVGNRDHTTVLHAFQKYDSRISDKPSDSDSKKQFASRIQNLKIRLDESFAAQMTLVR